MELFEKLKLCIFLAATNRYTKQDRLVVRWTSAWLLNEDRSASGAEAVERRKTSPGTKCAQAAAFWSRSLSELENKEVLERSTNLVLEGVLLSLGVDDAGITQALLDVASSYPEHSDNVTEPDGYRSYVDKGKEFLSRERWQQMLDVQDLRCAICGKHKSVCFKYFPKQKIKGFGLVVDHCHETGKIRGMICTKCKLGLSQFMENISTLQQAIEYLQKWNYSLDK